MAVKVQHAKFLGFDFSWWPRVVLEILPLLGRATYLTSSSIMASIVWLALAGIIVLFIITFVIILPVYTFILAVLTIIRQSQLQQTQTKRNDARGKHCNNSWDGISTSLFQGKVFHTRHQPMIHSFNYPLYFSVIDLDEASHMFGKDNVYPQKSHSAEQHNTTSSKGTLWPLSTLMMLRDIDHFKNGEGGLNFNAKVSMRLRISMLLYERTNGKMDLVEYNDDPSTRRRIVLVTHLMYYGYCFNPVSFFFILKSNNTNSKTDKNEIEEEIEAIVVEVSNTPWNEMSIYVLHPDSDDVVEYNVYPPKKNDNNSNNSSAADRFTTTSTHRYKWKKNFHVSPFMTMDHDYDWKFQVSNDRIKVEANMIKQAEVDTPGVANGDSKEKKGQLYFTAGFDIHRTIQPTTTYPLQLARIISRFPIYCFIIQVWIHYEAIRLLIKGVEFIPHPDGAETKASQAIAAVMRPVFAAKEWLCTVTSSAGDEEDKSKSD